MPLILGTTPKRPSPGLLLAGLLILALVVRGGVLLAMRDNLEADPDAYREIAENLLRYGEFALGKTTDEPTPTAYRPPLYPVVLSNLPAADGEHVSLGKVAVLHVLLGVATVWLTYLTARRYMTHTIEASALLASGGREPPEDRIASGDSIGYLRYAPLVAGVLVACDPILLNQQTLVMTETLATFLAILALWCLARFDGAPSWFNAGLAGGAICLAVLCRPTFLPWLGLVGAVMVLMRGRNAEFGMLNAERGTSNVRSWFSGLGSRLVNAAAVGIVAAAIVSPWVIRNYREFGKPIATTTHGGFTLYLGNNEDFYRWLTSDTSGRPWESEVFTMLWQLEGLITPSGLPEQQHHEIERDQRAYEHATAAMQRAPWIAIAASLYRMAQLWSPLPHKLSADESTGRTLLRYATAAWYCGVYVLAAVGMWRLRRRVLARPWIWGVLLCLVFTAVHAFYWSNLRMRAPLMPFVAIVAAAGLSSSHTSPKRKRG